MLANEILLFLIFFKRLDKDINALFQKYPQINWNPLEDIKIMRMSQLSSATFHDENEFLQYTKQLSQNKTIDYYPTFLKIIEVLGLSLLDKTFERIFLGNPDYQCSN